MFLKGRKVTLALDYDADILKPLEGLPDFKQNFIDSKQHQEQKRTIIKTALIEVLEAKHSSPTYRLSVTAVKTTHLPLTVLRHFF